MNCELEIWKDVLGYEGLYQISNFGQVKSLGRFIKGNSALQPKRWLDGRTLRPSLRGGYLSVQFHKNETGVFFSVSRLVALSFVDNPEPDYRIHVNHIDGDKENNVYTNLEWVTPSENALHSWKTGLQTPEGHYKILTESMVYRIRCIKKNLQPTEEYWRQTARSLGVSFSTIKNVVNGTTWKHLIAEEGK